MITAGAVSNPDASTLRTRRRVLAALAAVMVLAFGFSALAAAPVSAAEPPVTIDVLTINDFHGRIEADGSAAGAAVLAGAVNQFRDAGNTLFVSAGDNIGASTFTSAYQQDTPTIDALNATGLDVSALGDHELEQGRANLEDHVIPAANFPYLSANVYDRQTGQPAFEQYVVKEVDGITVGFIGAMTRQLPTLVNPAGITSLEVRDAVAEVNRVAADLHDGSTANGEADVIILLVHEGAATEKIAAATNDSAFARIVAETDPSVAAIVSAHTHQRYSHALPVAGRALPRPVIQAMDDGRFLGHLSLTVDPASHGLLSISSGFLPLFDDLGDPQFPADPAVTAVVAAAAAAADPVGAVSVGEIFDSINPARNANGGDNRGGESSLGNFVADVQLRATAAAGAQIALMQPGGLGANLSMHAGDPTRVPGDVSYRDVAGVHPVPHTLVTMDLTGDQLRRVLEEQWQPAEASWGFFKLGVSSSLFYTYDPFAPVGQHIIRMTFNGVEIAGNTVYRVVVNSFLASGANNFSALNSGTNRVDTGKTDRQAMLDYFAGVGLTEVGAASGPTGQRAVGVTGVSPDLDAYRPGQQITFRLSSLLMTDGERVTPEVTAHFGRDGVVLSPASFFPFDDTVVDGTDETGRSNVAFTIPANAQAGLSEIMFDVSGLGTHFSIPIVITEDGGPILVDTTTTASVQRHAVSHKRAVRLRVEVAAADGTTPAGALQVFDRGELVKTRALTAQKDGVVTTGITGLSRGVHTLSVQFSGSGTFGASESRTIRVVVY
ncbi:5'-nucleotidase C-terminal domain-containing protein [Cryobacterium ruanii]|uniref:Bifunctional metallophosphatase/5'-nucleotidase n=1 Tax=Cryobacterium ruanii TaxID=1259197 RepID=A0A4R9ATP0_9MICO|nr:5'-nucleotidase C-terminal domain-containing protein [Cryobacterium ruanii]TFD69774.1 bifunctional metallophosphatase/5'-nucleotidase [Cryobacterium ruanii]